MRAEGHHEIELFCVVQNFGQGAKKKRHRQGAGVVWDQRQHFLMRKASIETFIQSPDDLLLVKHFILRGDCL